jgi:dipeptidyl aminopeptidase/acylaminoacyl peptidase
VLRVIYQPPPTLTPFYVTPSATPGNILTVAALARTATYVATTTGTPTPWPPNVVTPGGTLAPGVAVIVHTPTPGNAATATYAAAEATARAFVFGTPTPWPTDAVTATPVPTFVVVTPVPTPVNVVTAAAIVARATAAAAARGTATSRPLNLATPTLPLVITNTPTPENAATAAWIATLQAAQALVYGTPTPLPPWAVTATPVPLLVYLDAVTRTPTPMATGPAPVPTIPPELRGKVLFLSDRLGKEKPDVLAYDLATGRVALVTQPWVYDRALALESLSPDGSQRVIVRTYGSDAQLWLQNTADGWQTLLTGELGGADYEPAWQPGGPLIAYVAQQDLNDEIYVVNKDTGQKRRLTINGWEWDKHPSWSPDGSQIIFWSNRQVGRQQIWIMNADGSDQRPLFQDEWNNWDPVWVK